MLYLGLYLLVAALLIGILSSMDEDEFIPLVFVWPVTLPFVLTLFLGLYLGELIKRRCTK